MLICLIYVQVFFPMIQISKKSHHFYVICFNLKTAEIDVIDNINSDFEDLDERYGAYANLLVSIVYISFFLTPYLLIIILNDYWIIDYLYLKTLLYYCKVLILSFNKDYLYLTASQNIQTHNQVLTHFIYDAVGFTMLCNSFNINFFFVSKF